MHHQIIDGIVGEFEQVRSIPAIIRIYLRIHGLGI